MMNSLRNCSNSNDEDSEEPSAAENTLETGILSKKKFNRREMFSRIQSDKLEVLPQRHSMLKSTKHFGIGFDINEILDESDSEDDDDDGRFTFSQKKRRCRSLPMIQIQKGIDLEQSSEPKRTFSFSRDNKFNSIDLSKEPKDQFLRSKQKLGKSLITPYDFEQPIKLTTIEDDQFEERSYFWTITGTALTTFAVLIAIGIAFQAINGGGLGL
mmetsp:Transcript_40333/g.45910  ORF Transcript_40333/g.45910 Transcript_40333/m.45910 type:complete len:213 (+) Transcript_40333:67-705(+)